MGLMLIGIGVCVLYLALLVGLQKRSGVSYTQIADSEPNLRRGVLVPVGASTVVLVALLALTGRLRDAFTYSPTTASWWLWAIPLAIVVGAVLRLATNDWSAVSTRFVVVALLATLLVGFSEELLVRGYLVDVLHQQGLSTVWVALASSVVFGVLHGANVLNGQDVRTTLLQVLLSTLIGLGLFASLALTGSLLLPIALHLLFDFSLLVGGSVRKDAAESSRAETALIAFTYLASVASLFFV